MCEESIQCHTAHIPLDFQTMVRRFEIKDTISRQYGHFSAMGTQLVIRLLPPANDIDPVSHFLARLNDLFRHALQ
jgi:hypothetical protein